MGESKVCFFYLHWKVAFRLLQDRNMAFQPLDYNLDTELQTGVFVYKTLIVSPLK